MSLQDQGFRFCLSPDAKKARWCHPAEIPVFYGNWLDVTDWPADKLEKFLMEKLPKTNTE